MQACQHHTLKGETFKRYVELAEAGVLQTVESHSAKQNSSARPEYRAADFHHEIDSPPASPRSNATSDSERPHYVQHSIEYVFRYTY